MALIVCKTKRIPFTALFVNTFLLMRLNQAVKVHNSGRENSKFGKFESNEAQINSNIKVPQSNNAEMNINHIDVPINVLKTKISELLLKQGHSKKNTDIITKTLMYAELRGNNQGIVKLITNGLLPSPDLNSDIDVVHDTMVSAKINGNQNIGMVVLSHAVDIAIEKAKKVGVGIVGCSNYSSATGALGHWGNIMSSSPHNCISIVMSQCPEYVAPYGSYEPIFGTNPIAIGLPVPLPSSDKQSSTATGGPIVLDMATSTCAYYHLVSSKQENKDIEYNLAYDSEGNITTDPVQALKGALMVFDRNYKGSHLALIIELLAGAWTGAAMNDKNNSKNWGSLVIAIDPNIFGPDTTTLHMFRENAEIMCQRVKQAKKLTDMKDTELWLPGERGNELKDRNIIKGSISMSKVIYEELLRQLQQ